MHVSVSIKLNITFLLIFALSSIFSSTSGFQKKIEVSNDGGMSTREIVASNNILFFDLSSPRKQKCNIRKTLRSLQQPYFLLKYRGGSDENESYENDSENETEVKKNEIEKNDIKVSEYDEEAEESEDYFDEEEDAEDDEVEVNLMKKSAYSEKKIVDPYFISPTLQIYTTFGTILLSRKIDMFNPKVVRFIRLLFVLQIVIQQAFIFYVRIMAKRGNDRTPIELKNPLTNMVESKLESRGGNDMVKNLASSFLKKESTVREYDTSQTSAMQGSILFNMLVMWFLHFKMQQVQPLLVSIVNGFVQLAYNPLFQVYIMGRNLERPFKTSEIFKPPTNTVETQQEEISKNGFPEDVEGDEVIAVTDEDVGNEEHEGISNKEVDDERPEKGIKDSDDDNGGGDDEDDDE